MKPIVIKILAGVFVLIGGLVLLDFFVLKRMFKSGKSKDLRKRIRFGSVEEEVKFIENRINEIVEGSKNGLIGALDNLEIIELKDRLAELGYEVA